ncbi:hypothetical protein VE03_10685 [Pseudogymnoascus sp. 23342-1-I1]|nr:hypothetical protein VE03_10685 [Pseudogymnoascus sp. 23342-1-I1]
MQIKAMSEQLSNCTLTINSIVSIAKLYSSMSNGQFTEEIKEMISTKRAELGSGSTTVYKQLIVLEDRLNDLNLSSDEEAAEVEGKTEALGQLKEQLIGLKASQDLLKELLSQIVVRNSGFQAQTINGGVNGIIFGRGGNGIVSADGNSGFQAGTINGGVSHLFFGGK